MKYTTLTKIESSVIKKPSVMVMDQITHQFISLILKEKQLWLCFN
ncbi:MAG: hypothetical protein LRZ96_00780 [Candidatus Pacebacteria bacterium]|nr:hypothetical protein [Candidatus Paceibacterota bacterium]